MSHLLITNWQKVMRLLVILSLFCALSLSQTAFAFDGFGMDDSYNQSLLGPAVNSTAAANTQAYSTDESAWQDMTYVQNQYAPSGNVQAPVYHTQNGAVSTFKGTSGDNINKPNLPRTKAGLMAVAGGYVKPACNMAGTGGFYAFGISRKYPLLPPTATTTVDLHVAY